MFAIRNLLLLVCTLQFAALQAQDHLEANLVPEDEGILYIVRDPSESIVIVSSTVPELSFESSNQIIRVEHPEPGSYHLHLSPGTHFLTIKADDYASALVQLALEPKTSREVQVRGIRVTRPKGKGSVMFITDPEGAGISINGNRIEGKTPVLALNDFPAGSYRAAMHGGIYYQMLDTLIQVIPDDEVEYRFSLKRSDKSWRSRKLAAGVSSVFIPGSGFAIHGLPKTGETTAGVIVGGVLWAALELNAETHTTKSVVLGGMAGIVAIGVYLYQVLVAWSWALEPEPPILEEE